MQKRRKELSKLVPGELSPMLDNLIWIEGLTFSQRANGDVVKAKHSINLATSVARALHLAGRERGKGASKSGLDIFGRDDDEENGWGDY